MPDALAVSPETSVRSSWPPLPSSSWPLEAEHWATALVAAVIQGKRADDFEATKAVADSGSTVPSRLAFIRVVTPTPEGRLEACEGVANMRTEQAITAVAALTRKFNLNSTLSLG